MGGQIGDLRRIALVRDQDSEGARSCTEAGLVSDSDGQVILAWVSVMGVVTQASCKSDFTFKTVQNNNR